MMWGYNFSGPGMLMMSLGSIILIVLIAVLIWALVTRQRTNATHPSPALSAMETVRQRYARGEIDAATFEQMRAPLETREQGPFAQSREPVEGVR
jgi:putative membrane protein